MCDINQLEVKKHHHISEKIRLRKNFLLKIFAD